MRAIASNMVEENGGVTVYNTVVEIDSYKDYYMYGKYEIFDVVMVDWNGHIISVYVDDEGMLKEGNFGRLVEGYPQPLFGDFVITGGVDEEGNTLPLPDEFTPNNINEFISSVEFIIRSN